MNALIVERDCLAFLVMDVAKQTTATRLVRRSTGSKENTRTNASFCNKGVALRWEESSHLNPVMAARPILDFVLEPSTVFEMTKYIP